jgi:predicted CDP-diglyceride synthetase/phosphatidate cytidylyltransferase
VIENLNARIAAWWGMVVLLAIAFLAGRAGVVLLFALLLCRAARVSQPDRQTRHRSLGAGRRPSS